MATSQARPRFLTAPLLAAKRVHVRPCLDCVVVLHGVHARPLVGAHQALTRPLAAGISTSLPATPCVTVRSPCRVAVVLGLQADRSCGFLSLTRASSWRGREREREREKESPRERRARRDN